MQNRYAADVGDFGKFGLLRSLCGTCPAAAPALSLGVAWYLVSRSEANNDGKHDGYLNLKDLPKREKRARQYSDCDPELYSALKRIRNQKTLAVADLQESGIFPPATAFFDDPLTYDAFPWEGTSTIGKRVALRKEWLRRALTATQGADVIFVDPDNGLEIPSTPFHAIDSPKHVFLDELGEFYTRKQSLIIYHHLNQHSKHVPQAKVSAKALDTKLGTRFKTITMHYCRGTSRVFYLKACSQQHEEIFTARVRTMLTSSWGSNGHFALISGGD